MVAMMVLPLILEYSNKSLSSSRDLKLSSPLVGSSRMSKLGSDIISMPMLTLFLSPPEIVFLSEFPTTVLRHFYRPRSSTTCCTL